MNLDEFIINKSCFVVFLLRCLKHGGKLLVLLYQRCRGPKVVALHIHLLLYGYLLNLTHFQNVSETGRVGMQDFKPGGGEESQQQPLVFFDLETTGLGQGCEIVQLAAVSGGHSINLYITPRCRMQQGASRVTGFRVRRQRLYLHRQLVLTNSLREVLVSFIAFLHMLGRPLLIGHNIRRFDCPLLTRALDETGLRPQFEASISGCVDTLPLVREMLKDRGLQSFRQESLVRELLGVNYKAHDALEDVRALQALYSVLQPTPELMCRHSFTLETTENKADAKCKVTCKAPEQQRPLWENFRQTLKVTESEENKR